MNASFCFAICSVFYIGLILVVFFSKERLKSTENKIYSVLMIVTFIGLCIEITSTVLELTNNSFNLFHTMILKLIMLYYLTWIYIFFIYTYYISKNKGSIKFTKFLLIYMVLAILTICLPLYAEKAASGMVAYTYGPSVNFVYGLSGILLLICIILMIINFRRIKKKKYVPLLAFIVVGALIATIQFIFPDVLLMSSLEAFVTLLMYFTIENPDVQMMRELYKNKKIIEKSNEDTSKFLFRITQDIKKPVKDAINISQDMNKMNNREDLLVAAKYINSYTSQIDYLINKALNISDMDTQKIKTYENKYNINNLFKEISFRAHEQIKNTIKFNFTISSNIPTYLYGDSIKLKQAVSSIINTANESTTSGFINLDVSTIIKYNICRLIITIEDSGKGLSIDKVNQILSLTNEDLEVINALSEDDRKLNILAVKKLINMLGGSLMIKSEPGEGTTITIVLDQKIVESDKTEISKKIDSYEQTLYGDKRILVIDDDERELAQITSMLEEDEAIVSSSVYERDCIEKARAKVKYDLIILDDEMPNYSALAILQELQKIKGFKTPVVVMINDNKEGIKLHYLKDGFADCIMKSKLDSEIKRIMKRF